jgi:hypothetical protein
LVLLRSDQGKKVVGVLLRFRAPLQ